MIGNRCRYVEDWCGQCLREAPTDTNMCAEHAMRRCWCGAQATHNCSHAGFLVCGAPLCEQHTENDCKYHRK